MQIFAPAASRLVAAASRLVAAASRLVAAASRLVAARSASKRLTPLGWQWGPEGGFSSLYGASRRLPGAPTTYGGGWRPRLL